MAITDKWEQLDPEKRQQYIKFGVISVVVGIALILYYGTGRDEIEPPKPVEELEVISLGDERLEDDIRATVEAEREEQNSRNILQDEKLKTQEAEMAALKSQLAALAEQQKLVESMPKSLEALDTKGIEMPPAPVGNGGNPEWPAQWSSTPGNSGDPNMAPVVEYIGGIGAMVNSDPVKDANGGKKKAGKRFYLPPSLVEAKTLTGLNAKTVDGAESNPEPMMLRIQAPAVLPNEVTAQLEGCFVIAHGYGSLASERVEARLVSLSCVDFGGRSMIDAEIQGIVTGPDGVKGLAAHPVSKMGTNLSRLMLAGFIQGAGEAFSEQSMTTNTSALGQTQTYDSGKIGQRGLGKGVSTASEELSKVYLELVRQSAPVLELGPSIDAGILITKGVWLEVQDYES